GTYLIVGCAPEATIVLDARGDGTLPPASNWDVRVLLPSLETPAYINVYGVSHTEGIVSLELPSTTVPYQIRVKSETGLKICYFFLCLLKFIKRSTKFWNNYCGWTHCAVGWFR